MVICKEIFVILNIGVRCMCRCRGESWLIVKGEGKIGRLN